MSAARATRSTAPRPSTSHRFSPAARSLMLEIALRKLAEREGVVADEDEE